VQLALLARAADLVVLGGVLVYAVCSIEPEETDDVVTRFLGARSDMVEEEVPALPAPARDRGRLRLLPGAAGCDGVFGTRFRRTGGL
jgi:16S rRNA (cytosine967-C5)-methyltransferase